MTESVKEQIRTHFTALCWAGSLLVATVVFWKFRILAGTPSDFIGFGNIDIFTEHYPMTRFGFEALSSASIPLWNPYQLCGVPFLAVPHVGLFYPGNLVYLLMETAAATELSFVLHLFWAGLGMYLLARTLGLSMAAGTASALTFMWSGWMVFYANQASLISGMSWLPMTILLVEWTIRGRRFAGIGVAITIGCLLLNGAAEFFVHNMYLTSAYVLMRLAQLAREHDWQLAVQRGALLIVCAVAGALLAAPQLLPSLELSSLSLRGATALSLEQIRAAGTLAPADFVSQTLTAQGKAGVGVLPLIGLVVGAGLRHRAVWIFALVVVAVSAALATSEDVFRLYYETPLGDLFRRPRKFLHPYSFGQALMAGFAVAYLEEMQTLTRAKLWRRVPWLAMIAGLSTLILFRLDDERAGVYLVAALVLLGLFGGVTSPRLRGAAIVGLLLVQASNLFLGAEMRFQRPAANPKILSGHGNLLEALRSGAGPYRVHIASGFRHTPGLMQKQGMLNDLRVVGDYEPFVLLRAAQFFERVTPAVNASPFDGSLALRSETNWNMMDLTSTRFYLAKRGAPLDDLLRKQASESERTGVSFKRAERGGVRLYERSSALPRAYFVGSGRHIESSEALLDALADPSFDPRREVLLEGLPASDERPVHAPRRNPPVEIARDERHRVDLVVEASEPGFVVLTDAFYPGWLASKNGVAVPVLPANHLFRAIAVGAGRSEITMQYRSTPFRTGLWLSGGSALGLCGLALWTRRGSGRAAAGGAAS